MLRGKIPDSGSPAAATPSSDSNGRGRLARDRDRSEGRSGSTAGRALISTVVAVAVIVGALALWKLKLVIALFFLAVIVAAAMRPGVEALRRRGIPRGIGVVIHYLGVLALVALFLWFALPRALTQVEAAVGSVPTSSAQLTQAANHSTGVKLPDVVVTPFQYVDGLTDTAKR